MISTFARSLFRDSSVRRSLLSLSWTVACNFDHSGSDSGLQSIYSGAEREGQTDVVPLRPLRTAQRRHAQARLPKVRGDGACPGNVYGQGALARAGDANVQKVEELGC